MKANNNIAMLILGLGNTGYLAAQRFKALSGMHGRAVWEVRVFDQDGTEQVDPPPLGLPELDRGELHVLPAKEARQLLRNATAWSPYLDWLGYRRELREIDELASRGGGGQRWLGRLSFFAADESIQHTIRASLARLRQRSGVELERVVLVASVGGGTGSGLLADMTYLVEHLAQQASRVAYLLLPGTGTSEPLRSYANAYATIKELFFLKYQRLPFAAHYPRLGERRVPPGEREPWQRLYLFSPSEGEAPPYLETIGRMALAISAQVREDLRSHSIFLSQHEVELSENWDNQSPRADFCFSTCELLQGSALSADSLEVRVVGADSALPESQGMLASDRESSGSQEPRERVEESESVMLFKIHVGAVLRDGANKVLTRTEEELSQFEERSHDLKRREKRDVLREIEKIERAIWMVLPYKESGSRFGQVAWWSRLLRWLTKKWKELSAPRVATVEGELKNLPGWDEAQELVKEGLQRYLIAIPSGARRDGGRAIAGKYREECASSGSPHSTATLEIALREQRELINGSLSEEVENRCAAVRAIVKDNGFHHRLRLSLLEVEFPAQGEAPGKEANGDAAETLEKRSEDGQQLTSQVSWKDRIDVVLCAAERNVFIKAERPGPSRTFVVVLLPESLVQEEEVEGEISEYTKDQCQRILSGQCEIVITVDDRISVYYEDLFHSHCEIRNLQYWKEAYLREPKRERLHTHFQFVPLSRFEELCGKGAPYLRTFCGNPGCSGNIGSLPPNSRTCPSCGRPIRSRCGNEGCAAQDLHTREDWKHRSCPVCGGFNHAAWWLCCRHGKVQVWVPIDKKLCPECLVRHQEVPALFSEDSVGRRPHGRDGRECPNCRRLAESQSEQKIFTIPEDLIRFFKDGVNGHDRRVLADLAEKHGLAEGYKCPTCRTVLIPIYGTGARCSEAERCPI